MTELEPQGAQPRRDLVVVGGSAGALPALQAILSGLDTTFSASVLVVLHGPASARHHLAAVLARDTGIAVAEARDGEPLRPGRVHVAPSDRHMLVANDHVHLRRGPTENGFRPAIDPLFRSAALTAGTRTVGLILSGTLDDGASGLRAIKEAGGVAMVQDPADAEYGEMPAAADGAATADHVLPAALIAERLRAIVGRPVPPPVEGPDALRIEVLIAGLEEATMRSEFELGRLSPFSCPDCNGNLWEIEEGARKRYRCHTGHAYSAAVLNEMQKSELERRLYEVLRAQRERAELLRRMAKEGGPQTRAVMRQRGAATRRTPR